MKRSKNRSIKKRLNAIVSGANKRDVLAAIWDTAPFLNSLVSVKAKDYYLDAKTKLDTQLWFQEQFPGLLLFPGIWSDYGAVCEPSAFGCEIGWKGDSP